MTLTAGRRLGPYEIVSAIGASGMGEVYKARDTRLDRTVAIKVLPALLAGDAQLRERFEREAQTISSLNHPHICTLYGVGREGDIDFLVLEHLEGETLADRTGQRAGDSPGLPVSEALTIALQIARCPAPRAPGVPRVREHRVSPSRFWRLTRIHPRPDHATRRAWSCQTAGPDRGTTFASARRPLGYQRTSDGHSEMSIRSATSSRR